MASRIGEVIEASTAEFLAECYELHEPPPLGALVKTTLRDAEIYGIVCNSSTSGIDPARRPLARGRDEAEADDIYKQHPQLSRLLRTTFKAVITGYSEGRDIHHYISPRPPRIHDFVFICSPGEISAFTRSLDFLPALLRATEGPADDIVSACLRRASQAHEDPRAFLIGAGKELALLLSGELNRLNAILRRIRP
ncbi:MAG: hypothetical protein IBX68_07170 [Dehalococcoidia bacterium]|nr:hypothetical protein [Dehalococcoidia bacterium]